MDLKYYKEAGFALPVVLLVISLLSVLAFGLSRLAASQVAELQVRKDMWDDEKFAHSKLNEIAFTLLVGRYSEREVALEQESIFIDGAQMGVKNGLVSVQDGAGLFSLAFYNREKFIKLLESITTKDSASRISSELGDWIDEDNVRQYKGMEVAGYISKRLAQRPRNAPVRSLDELLELPSMTLDVYNGGDGRKGISELVLAGGVDHFNAATAPDEVAGAMLDLSSADLAEFLSVRKRGDWKKVADFLNSNDWIYNGLPPFTSGNRFNISMVGAKGNEIRVKLELKPYNHNRLFSILDWQAPYYPSE